MSPSMFLLDTANDSGGILLAERPLLLGLEAFGRHVYFPEKGCITHVEHVAKRGSHLEAETEHV